MNFIKFIRIFLLVLIVIGVGLLVTQKMWVPKVVDVILKAEGNVSQNNSLPIIPQKTAIKPNQPNTSIYTSITVKAEKEQVGSNYRFTYRVINNTDRAVSGISIGINNEGIPILDFAPLGRNYIDGSIPNTSYTSPAGWEFSILTDEESDSKALIWSALQSKNQIPRGLGLSGFSVLVPWDDTTYLSTFSAALENGSIVTGNIVLDK